MADTANVETHELQDISVEEGEAAGHSLPPCDGGRAAWTLIAAAYVFEALLWGHYSCVPEVIDRWLRSTLRLPTVLWSVPGLLLSTLTIQE